MQSLRLFKKLKGTAAAIVEIRTICSLGAPTFDSKYIANLIRAFKIDDITIFISIKFNDDY